ncbi:MAG: hypothetical protein P8P36_02905 [Akkermansiaceae bacterium]|nr:hypothetical protein [Akkermansiaceae bacterium]
MKRNVVSLSIAVLFLSLAVTGVMGFFLPFNILTVSVHALLGFVFIGSIALHLKNNFRQLKNYFTSKTALLVILCVAILVAVILIQPKPVLAILGLSKNLGPAADRFELIDTKVVYNYTPAPHYKMRLDFKGGSAFDADNPPHMAIWLENTSRYHLKTLYHSKASDVQNSLPYWHYKKSEYEKYKAESEAAEKAGKKQAEDVDALSSATPNESFDPADYIVPKDPEKETPYRLLIEINAPRDKNEHYPDQPSLVYVVEVDNKNPRSYQVLDLVGYPESEMDEEEGELEWSLLYTDETITTAHDLFDSALLHIERSEPLK